ncbi:hypothetical protein EDD85DRAFT_793877 [Armillaria nabsnona]|nr:hypothetical protein EDD85DRAFT_793877 [Armillaria nabsnona]
MARMHPEFLLCENRWKADQMAIDNYSQWYRAHSKMMQNESRESDDGDDVEDEDEGEDEVTEDKDEDAEDKDEDPEDEDQIVDKNNAQAQDRNEDNDKNPNQAKEKDQNNLEDHAHQDFAMGIDDEEALDIMLSDTQHNEDLGLDDLNVVNPLLGLSSNSGDIDKALPPSIDQQPMNITGGVGSTPPPTNVASPKRNHQPASIEPNGEPEKQQQRKERVPYAVPTTREGPKARCGKVWLTENPGGFSDDFEVYWKGLSNEAKRVYQKVPNKPRTKVCLSTELSWILLRRVIIDKIAQVLDIPRSLSWLSGKLNIGTDFELYSVIMWDLAVGTILFGDCQTSTASLV